jgi:quinoprotein glucose dehydrogenase
MPIPDRAKILLCLLLTSPLSSSAASKNQTADWPNVGNDKGGMRYSPLDQINRTNVQRLEPAWTYHTGDSAKGNGSTIECTPIEIGGVLFLTTAKSKVIALDAATGTERWKFDPYADYKLTQPLASGGVNRGVVYWAEGKQARIFLGTADGRLISLNARSGKPDHAFGKDGTVDLRAGMEDDLKGVNYGPTSAPVIWRNIIIVGFSCPEGGRPAPGDPRAFDARTGKELWRFHTIPRPGEFGHETWQDDGWKLAGAANNWGGASVDEKRGLVFLGTGSASPDFYGGKRKGDNLFANCVICLDAKTGKREWHYQTLHHDLWDHDLPTHPNLVVVNHNGHKRDAAVQVTKTGHVFLFDRLSGEPLFPIEERPVPPSDVPGELAAATQPIPAKPPPFCRQSVTETDLTDISAAAHEDALKKFRGYRGGPIFTPPSTNGTVVIPGFHGGATWSGASFDPQTAILYVNSNEQPNVTHLVFEDEDAREPFRHTGYYRFVDKDNYPAIKPPWGQLNAIDLNKGEILWQVPLGEFPELKARGIPQTGTENFGGTIVTAGGLVFIAGTKDEKFHAFDKTTGKLLWDFKLTAGGYATPCTYMTGGRQFVVIAAGGGGKLGTKSGDEFVAFALAR